MFSIRNALIAAALSAVLLGGCTFKASGLPGAVDSGSGNPSQGNNTGPGGNQNAHGVRAGTNGPRPAPPLIIYRGGEG